MTKKKLPFSNRSFQNVVDGTGERVVSVEDLCDHLRVDALLRIHRQEYDFVEQLKVRYVHFNLEFTLNEQGKRYALLPIVRSGHRTADGNEVLPTLDPMRRRIGVCEFVRQQVPVQDVTPEFFENSIKTIQSQADLRDALLERYSPMFPNLSAAQLLDRGCAITQIRFVSE
jgi:hypothetical protein